MSQADQARSTVEPLTHRNLDGAVYRRDPAVEQQLAEATRLPPSQWRARADIADKTAAGYLQEEALVYLLRIAHRQSEAAVASDLSEALLRRCGRFIYGHLTKLGNETADEGYSEVVAQLFERILDLDSDRGDFYQVRFWPALEKLAIRAFQRLLKERKRGQQTISISDVAGYDDDADEDRRVVQAPELATPSDESFVITNDLVRDALTRVGEPYRTAFLLRHYAGWPTEDQDPAVQTISKYFKKDPRTIRNWLKRAEEALQQWRGEQQEP